MICLSNSAPSSYPIKLATLNDHEVYYIIVIDALDECSASGVVEILIKTILDGVAEIPLKFFITSRPEDWVKRAFRYHPSHLSDR